MPSSVARLEEVPGGGGSPSSPVTASPGTGGIKPDRKHNTNSSRGVKIPFAEMQRYNWRLAYPGIGNSSSGLVVGSKKNWKIEGTEGKVETSCFYQLYRNFAQGLLLYRVVSESRCIGLFLKVVSFFNEKRFFLERINILLENEITMTNLVQNSCTNN